MQYTYSQNMNSPLSPVLIVLAGIIVTLVLAYIVVKVIKRFKKGP